MIHDHPINLTPIKDRLGKVGYYDAISGPAIAAMVEEIELLRVEVKSLTAWQEKVCRIIQPAESAREWGKDVADIIKMREKQRRSRFH